MARRLELHEKLCEILGSRNVYFQPPESLAIKYPAIIYKVLDRDDIRADDRRYRGYTAYEGNFVTRDPDSPIPEMMYNYFNYYSSGRPYTSGNLHHNPFTLYY